MTMLRSWTVVALLGVAAVGAGCATGGAAAGAEANVTVLVENNLIPPTSLSIYAVPEVGTRRLLGVVEPSTTRTLSFRATSAGNYRFVAETTGGADIASNPLPLRAGDTVRWDLSSNIAVVR